MKPEIIRLRAKFLNELKDKKIVNRHMLFSELDESSRQDHAKIFELENQEGIFFKHAPLNEYTLDCLENNSVYLRDSNTFNDPYEMKAFIMHSKDSLLTNQQKENLLQDFDPEWKNKNRRGRKFILNRINTQRDAEKHIKNLPIYQSIKDKEFFPEANDPNEDYYLSGDDKTLVGCFSSTNKSILMWSHYADNHRGVCIGYDFNKYKHLLYPIDYREDYFDNCSQNVADSPYAADCAKLIKCIEWCYEHEWRIILTEFMVKKLNSFWPTIGNFNTISDFSYCKIYLGAKFDDNFRDNKTKGGAQRVLDIAKKYNISVFKMRMEYGKFRLAEEKLIH